MNKKIFFTIRTNEKYYRLKQSTDITLKVFQSKKNRPNYIWELKYNTSTTRWEDSEIYNFLIDNKIIPKKAFDFSTSSSTWPWCYRSYNPWCEIINLY